ncbi:MAG: hypothetical protein A2W93_16120 [Bacteroidetes bacterium GWF2_43_63]|nr:MAG: hypothetical protein A2W94_11115 [Bacteroidetes bacterium GWE2_42_42]OFY54251.1 MAG: hypothetical protein A2W93_16120 [Bacteroidetes bacterium GWF2_43_63]HBG69355.1 hypothetical protein [Bacteroidales bacterium]HCB60408.1 hypothetical protein [Bacteroidales bacterium]HCY23605.1 hypothetical protein [Bacteroidales bacterium]
MITNMLRTLAVRVLTALISLGIVVVSSQMLGVEVVGEISLVIISITIINLVGGFAGGAALVYLIPRNAGARLLPVSQFWALSSGLFTTAILFFIGAFPAEMVWHVLILGTVGSLIQNYLSVLLANQRIKAHNFLSLIQAVLMIGSLLVFTFLFKVTDISAYVFALYASYLPVLIVSFILVRNEKQIGQGSSKAALKVLFGYGSLVQVSSILALLTYRLTYYYTEAWLGLAALGLLSVAAQISEAVWILPKSIALVQFSKISNLKNDNDSAHLTFFLGTVTSVLTLVALAILVLLPDQVYTLIFGSDFKGINAVVQIFAPGILAMSLNIILSHYFSGTGRIIFNLSGSAIGLVTVALAGWFFIRQGNVSDAAMVSTIGYAANFLFAWLCFFWITRRKELSLRKGFLVFRETPK